MWPFTRKIETKVELPRASAGLFSTHTDASLLRRMRVELPQIKLPTITVSDTGQDSGTMSGDEGNSIKPNLDNGFYGIPDAQLGWYVSQGFIGYQTMSILSQHWLIDKACSLTGQDAVRKGWELTGDDGKELTPEMIAYITKIDKRMRIKQNLQEYSRKGRIFGIRVAIFKVDSDDPDYYQKPFNIDGVGAGKYKGIVQIDPYWITPELTANNLIDADSLHFYEPEFWRVSGKLYHRSHLCIYTTGVVPDVLKSNYYYGGVSITQQIYERVYAAERTANEAPMLTMTKRLTVLSTDLEEAMANETVFNERMEWWRLTRDNYGVKINGLEDKIEQHDLTLTDLGPTIMTQYQIVAMIAKVPGTKLLGTQPKGFSATGEFEESSYHEELESEQENKFSPLLDRHYMLVEKSFLQPKFNTDVSINHNWRELDAMTAQEQAAVNAAKAATGLTLIQSGAIESQDERDRLIADKDSGYNGLSPNVPPMPDDPAGDPSLQPPPAAGAKLSAAGNHAEAGF